MRINKILVGLAITSVVLYMIATYEIGPCSPEMELLINGK